MLHEQEEKYRRAVGVGGKTQQSTVNRRTKPYCKYYLLTAMHNNRAETSKKI